MSSSGISRADIQASLRFYLLDPKNKSSFYIFPLFDAEPVGSKAPSFSTEGTSIKRQAVQNFALLCQAQAFPVPLFRQVLLDL